VTRLQAGRPSFFLLVGDSSVPTVSTLYSVGWCDIELVMNWKLCGTKRYWPHGGSIQAFTPRA
jgi:hypothetical protein